MIPMIPYSGLSQKRHAFLLWREKCYIEAVDLRWLVTRADLHSVNSPNVSKLHPPVAVFPAKLPIIFQVRNQTWRRRTLPVLRLGQLARSTISSWRKDGKQRENKKRWGSAGWRDAHGSLETLETARWCLMKNAPSRLQRHSWVIVMLLWSPLLPSPCHHKQQDTSIVMFQHVPASCKLPFDLEE